MTSRTAALGVGARVVAVLPQPYYRWDGNHHFHDIALLALDRPLSQTPAVLAEQRPGAGKSLLIAGYGRSSTKDHTGPRSVAIGQIDAADPATCHLISEAFNPSWLFCGSAAVRPTRSCRAGRPASAIREARRSPPRTPRATSSSRA